MVGDAASDARERRWLLLCTALFALAWLTRAGYLLELQGNELFRTPLVDAAGYDQWAQGLAGLRPYEEQVFFQPPLYPYALSLVYRAAGRDLDLVRSLQITAGAAAAVLLAGAGRRLFGARAGLFAGTLLALYPMALFYDGQLEKTSLAMLALCAALRLALVQRGRALAAVACGGSLGALGLLRENALVLVPLLGVWFAVTPASRPRPRRLADAGLVGVGLLLALGPVAIHNAARGGGLLPTTFQGGVNLWIGNGQGADGTYRPLTYGAAGPAAEREAAVSLAERAVGRKLTEGEVSSYWTRRTVDDVRSDPVAWGRLMLRKWLLCWNDGEPIDSESHLAYADSSHVLAGLLRVLPFSTLFALALWGCAATWRDARRTWLVHAAVIVLTASVALFFVFSRYRMMLVPPLALLAGAGLHALRGPWTPRRAALLAAALLAGLVTSRVPASAALGPAEARATTYCNLGSALGREGRLPEAEDSLRQALALQPGLVEANATLGEVLFRQRRVAESAANDAHALELLPPDGPVRAHVEWRLGAALILLGHPDAALAPLEAARAHAPGDPQVLRALGAAFRALGRTAEAQEANAQAEALERVAPRAR